MEESLGGSRPLLVYEEDYALELKVFASATAILAIIVVAGTVVRSRQTEKVYQSLLVCDGFAPADVIHAPILLIDDDEDDDSFEEDDEDDDSDGDEGKE